MSSSYQIRVEMKIKYNIYIKINKNNKNNYNNQLLPFLINKRLCQ